MKWYATVKQDREGENIIKLHINTFNKYLHILSKEEEESTCHLIKKHRLGYLVG